MDFLKGSVKSGTFAEGCTLGRRTFGNTIEKCVLKGFNASPEEFSEGGKERTTNSRSLFSDEIYSEPYTINPDLPEQKRPEPF